MTFSEQLLKVVVSYCLYTCNYDLHHEFIEVDASLTTDDLNDRVCKLYNRTGLMCGRCIERHAPAAYSYTLACVNCSNNSNNVLKYVAVAYVPLTAFYLLVIMFRIPINSGAMIAYVGLSQVFAAPGLVTFYSARFERHGIKYINKLLIFYTVWNLDFFRSLYEPFCLHPNLTTVDIVSLDYAVAVYPLVLTVVMYLFVQFHDRSRLLRLVCRPMHKCLYRFRKVWNIKDSLVKAFATFLVLSYVKIMNVSTELLTPAHGYYDINGTVVNEQFLYSNGSMVYFGEDHVPYVVLAIFMSILFTFLPLLLLCVYPCQCCQKIMNLLPFRHSVLHIFMDTLQGEFKEQPRNYRYFAGFYVALRLINLVLYAYFKSPVYYLAMVCVMTFFAVLVAVVRHKSSIYNSLDPWLFFLQIMSYLVLSMRLEGLYVAAKEVPHYNFVANSVLFIVVNVFPLYGAFLLVYRLFPSLKVKRFLKWMRQFKHRQEMEESLLFQGREYTRLL
jgi:hypothetical protein